MNALALVLLVGFSFATLSRAATLDDFQRNQAEPLARLQAQLLAQPETWNPSPEDRKLLDSLDSTCHQRDCLLSRLPWHTDLNEAKAEAKAKKRPILSLHLLGRL